MPYEVECGECHEQILIEDLGVEVACPHCETTLILNAEDVGEIEQTLDVEEKAIPSTEEPASFDFNFVDNSAVQETEENGSDSGVSSAILTEDDVETDSTDPDTHVGQGMPNFNFLHSAPQSTPDDVPLISIDTTAEEPAAEETVADDETISDIAEPAEVEAAASDVAVDPAVIDTPEAEAPSFNFTEPPVPTPEAGILIDTSAPPAAEENSETNTAEADVDDSNVIDDDVPQEPQTEALENLEATGTTEPEPEKTLDATVSYAQRNRGVSGKVVQFLISYSILITIAFLYLFNSFFQAKPHQLESLPDIIPAEEGEFHHIRENASLAPGHSLKIGESQRFGNIRVTPLKVTKAPLQFEHFQGLLGDSLPSTRPVLKLWLKIENVSKDQSFPPTDLDLLTLREHDPQDYKRVYANNWICRESDLSSSDNRLLMYNHPPTSEYDIQGLVTRPLKPGETVETFLPTQEKDLGKLTGDLVWRFQIRKGFHPVSMNGVTTLVEVLFSSEDVQKEAS